MRLRCVQCLVTQGSSLVTAVLLCGARGRKVRLIWPAWQAVSVLSFTRCVELAGAGGSRSRTDWVTAPAPLTSPVSVPAAPTRLRFRWVCDAESLVGTRQKELS